MSIKLGTCTWNYDSWLGLVYSYKANSAAEYLKQYSQKYRTVEIDSWFYKIPDKAEVLSYKNSVDSDFSFTCKVTNAITLTNLRNKNKDRNPDLLSSELFKRYLDSIEALLPQIDGIMFEFEYLNKTKMSGAQEFLERLNDFFEKVPSGLPLAIETRNKNYLTNDYFKMLNDNKVMHVFSEKLYMPSVYNVYAKFQDYINDGAIIRLLGGDRKEIEKQTKKQWDNIVQPKDDLKQVVGMINYMSGKGLKITANVNNHYEGSAPKTIMKMIEMLR
ncbi:MAG: DUF72 domain-containing protein [Spirochaetales bacterium]|uniref:DUF72 domain-containing protein n=1 Tax=Candidatus Thalassospirochaeta sargassi TaxID=3119039 RepID=A0AAJ1IFS6_9SPIO|nr:DUF72 domain-containing protein [Spirochaetales bacterium]